MFYGSADKKIVDELYQLAIRHEALAKGFRDSYWNVAKEYWTTEIGKRLKSAHPEYFKISKPIPCTMEFDTGREDILLSGVRHLFLDIVIVAHYKTKKGHWSKNPNTYLCDWAVNTIMPLDKPK